TVLPAEDDQEDQCRGDDGSHVGDECGHAPPGLRAQLAVEQVGEDQRDDQLRHRGEKEDAEGVVERVEEVTVGEDPLEVSEAIPAVLLRSEDVPAAEGDDAVEDDREEPEDSKQDEERGDKNVRHVLLVEVVELRQPARPFTLTWWRLASATAGRRGGHRWCGG